MSSVRWEITKQFSGEAGELIFTEMAPIRPVWHSAAKPLSETDGGKISEWALDFKKKKKKNPLSYCLNFCLFLILLSFEGFIHPPCLAPATFCMLSYFSRSGHPATHPPVIYSSPPPAYEFWFHFYAPKAPKWRWDGVFWWWWEGRGRKVDVDGRKRNRPKLTVQTKIGFKHHYSGNFTAA